MYSDNKSKAKIGKVSIDITGDRYRLRFTYPKGVRHQFKIIGEVNDDTWALALKTASLVNRDITLDDVDTTYARYSAYKAQSISIINEQPNLIQIWERYKDLNKNRIAQTTQKYLWKDCDRYLSRADKHLLELSNAQEFVSYLQTEYAVSTIATLFRSCLNPAVNTAVNAGIVTINPFKSINIPKPQKKPIEAFEPHEVKAIIAAFYSDEYNPKSSGYQHSFYAQYVEMLALTGARPEEIVALTFNDIKHKGGKTYIKFSKAYSKGVLLNHTKTKEIRLFPVNNQLSKILDSIPRKRNKHNLLFTNIEGNYLNHNNFRDDNWRTVLKSLVEDEKVEKYLKPYALRHSFITRLVREGVDIKTVATLSGNSVNTIIKHYLASRDDFELPPLL